MTLGNGARTPRLRSSMRWPRDRRNSQMDGIPLDGSVIRPLAVLPFLLLFGLGQQQARAVSGEKRVRDAMLRVEGMQVFAGDGVEEGQVPLSLKEPAGHGEVALGRMKRQRFHQALTALAFVRLVELLAVAPGEALPALHADASHRIAHRPHAADEEFA